MKLLRRIKAYIRLRKNKNFLRKNSVSSWKDYNKVYDKDIIRYATIVSHYYHGYAYTCYFEEVPELYRPMNGWLTWLKEMDKWAETNCSDKFRYDIHRVIREKGLIHNEYDDTILWSDIEDFSMNDIGGRDILFFAFKSERDLSWFKLRWQ
jgi:hypothetical protein